MGIYGIDVSSYQAEHFPTTVAGHPVDFAFIKATESTNYINPHQAGQTAWARSHGFVVGFYHFLHAGNVKAQAAYCVAKAASVAGDILACDWEMAGVSGADKDAFMKEVKRLRPDHRVMLYADKNHWLNVDKTSYCGDGLWLANYNGSPATTGVTHAVMIHQYTSTPVDTNYASAWASRAAMKAWAGGSTTPPKNTSPAKDDTVTYSVQSMADNYGKITSIPVNSGDKAENHAGGYYLAHIHYDALVMKNMIATLSKKLDALPAQNWAYRIDNPDSGEHNQAATYLQVMSSLADRLDKIETALAALAPKA